MAADTRSGPRRRVGRPRAAAAARLPRRRSIRAAALRSEQNSERAGQLLGVRVHLRGVGPELWTASKGGSHRVDDELHVFSEQLAERRLQPRERAIEAGREGLRHDRPRIPAAMTVPSANWHS